jgi:glycosyltransferase involved in cell wall biosynthesis
MRRPVPVTVVVLTYNEATNISACIESLGVFAKIIVVDSGSTDGTVEKVREQFPAVAVLAHPFEDFGQQRNWAIDHAGAPHDWILFFDADERCTEACGEAIRAAVASSGPHVGFFLCYRNIFLGRWIKRCTLYPTWQLRLLKVGHVRYRKEGHGQREVMSGSAGYIAEPYDHYGFSKGVKNWIARHNEYSSNEIELIDNLVSTPVGILGVLSRDPVRRRRTLKALAARAPLRPLVRFFYLYVLRCGFLDGRAGFLFCLLRLAHECHIVVKRAERSATHGNQAVSAPPAARFRDKAAGLNA